MQDQEILDRGVAAIGELGLRTRRRARMPGIQGFEPDAVYEVGKGDERTTYLVEVRRTLSAATVGATVAQLREYARLAGKQILLVTTHVTPPVALRLKELGQQFIDVSGNAYLEGKAFLVWSSGHKSSHGDRRPKANRAFASTGLKITFALLSDRLLVQRPYREIAAAAGVSLGAVTPVLDDLRNAGHLTVSGRKREFRGNKRLLTDWATAYSHVLRPKLLLQTMTTDHAGDWRSWDLKSDQAQWGAEPGAAWLVDALTPGVLTIYTQKPPTRLVFEQRLKLYDRSPSRLMPVEIRRRFWGSGVADLQAETVPPALIYADLLATGDARCVEAAELVYDAHLARSISKD